MNSFSQRMIEVASTLAVLAALEQALVYHPVSTAF